MQKHFGFLFLIALCVACEKVDLNEFDPGTDVSQTEKTIGNLTLHIAQLQEMPFSLEANNANTDTECTHLCFAIYDMGGTRLKQVNQKQDDINYGTVSLQLDKGNYQLVALAHSSTKNPSMTNPAKIQFNNSTGYTDTYLFYTTLTVTDEPQTYALTLDRIAALCRFVISDPIPDGVSQIRFQYKGGSGHLSALTGLGVTNSTQVVTRQVQPGQQYQAFDLYTFLHQEEGTIALTATALNAAGEEYCAWEFQIPMKRNQITWLTGNFFADEDDPDLWRVTPNIEFDKRWGNEVFYTY